MADAAGTPLQALAGLGLACALCAAPPAWADGAATSVQLQHLALDLQLDWPARQLVGVASLQLLTTTATQQVQLRAADLAVQTVHDGAGQPLAHRSSGNGDAGRLVIDLPQPLPAAAPEEAAPVPVAEATASGRTVLTSARSGANIRSSAGGGEVVRTVPRSSTLAVLREAPGGWLQVAESGQPVGWIHNSLIEGAGN